VYLISFNDAHCADVPPESRLDVDYLATILSKMDQIVKVAKKLEAAAVLNAGDLFHIKTASRNSHAMIQRLMSMFRGVNLLSIAGNHDIVMDRLDSLSRQPLGDLITAGVSQYLHQNSVLFEEDVSVRVAGLSFVPNVSEFAGAPEFTKQGADYLVMMMHCAAALKGGVMFGEPVLGYHQLGEWFPDVDVFVLGHLHFYTGIHEVNGKLFVNIGALTRASLHLDNLQRKVLAGLIKLTKEKVTCKALELKVLPVQQVLSVERHEELKEERRKMDEFISQLAAEGMEVGPGDAVRSYLSKIDISDVVRERALQLLEAAGLDSNES
jgi:DNA repair exonuclease SbcCD nuclease subunit